MVKGFSATQLPMSCAVKWVEINHESASCFVKPNYWCKINWRLQGLFDCLQTNITTVYFVFMHLHYVFLHNLLSICYDFRSLGLTLIRTLLLTRPNQQSVKKKYSPVYSAPWEVIWRVPCKIYPVKSTQILFRLAHWKKLGVILIVYQKKSDEHPEKIWVDFTG